MAVYNHIERTRYDNKSINERIKRKLVSIPAKPAKPMKSPKQDGTNDK